ncbi:SRPBCC family protein [Streptomyces sp. NPDC007988]|uniref:aromatase/cyclase n=1 Tax=Streptomyces sp. NPDC007988 TaxID=3364802 RepID=UPI0036E678BF
MSSITKGSAHSVTVEAPVELVFDLVADVEQHRRIFNSVIHTAYAERGEDSERVERWSWIQPLDSVRAWRARRELDRAAGRITFVHENPAAPLTAATGEWSFKPQSGGVTEVELRHEYTLDGTAAGGEEAVQLLDRGATAQLEQLKSFVDARDDIAELEVSYEAQLVIDEPIEDVYNYFYEADRWNERIPHCLSASAKEDIEHLQVVVMDVQVPSGALHTTKQARVCFPNEKIIWRQLEGLPPLDDMLYGYMYFEQTPEGVLVRTGQTELLKRNGVAKRGWTVEEAKGHVAEVRGGRNLDSLKSAQEFLRRRRA